MFCPTFRSQLVYKKDSLLANKPDFTSDAIKLLQSMINFLISPSEHRFTPPVNVTETIAQLYVRDSSLLNLNHSFQASRYSMNVIFEAIMVNTFAQAL